MPIKRCHRGQKKGTAAHSLMKFSFWTRLLESISNQFTTKSNPNVGKRLCDTFTFRTSQSSTRWVFSFFRHTPEFHFTIIQECASSREYCMDLCRGLASTWLERTITVTLILPQISHGTCRGQEIVAPHQNTRTFLVEPNGLTRITLIIWKPLHVLFFTHTKEIFTNLWLVRKEQQFSMYYFPRTMSQTETVHFTTLLTTQKR